MNKTKSRSPKLATCTCQMFSNNLSVSVYKPRPSVDLSAAVTLKNVGIGKCHSIRASDSESMLRKG